MVNCQTLNRTAALLALAGAALVSVSCGPVNSSQTPDPDRGFVTADPWDTKFFSAAAATATTQPWQVRCIGAKCYPSQQVWIHGQPVYVYNLVQVLMKTSAGAAVMPADKAGNPILPLTLSTMSAYDFPTNCIPGAPYDQQADRYTTEFQYPIFDKLPIANTKLAYGVLPIVAVHGVTGVGGNTCNDLKSYASVGTDAADPGKFGAVADGTTSYRIFVPVEENYAPTLPLRQCAPDQIPTPSTPNLCPESVNLQGYAWFNNLQLGYVRGGAVPLDSTGTQFQAMEAVIVDQLSGTTSHNNSTDMGTVLLPFAPGEPGWSPIVRVHDFVYPTADKGIGYWTGVCNSDPNPGPTKKLPVIPCGPNDVDMASSAVATSAYQTLFLAVP